MRLLQAGVPIFVLALQVGFPCFAESESSSQPLMPYFERAAAEHCVPIDLLLVLARMGSGFEDRGAAPTIEGGYGLTALRLNRWGADSLLLGARLMGAEAERLKTEAALNVRGAAAVLSAYADDAGIDRSAGVEAWEPMLVRFAGLDAEDSQLFAEEVFAKLASGFVVTNRGGETFRVGPRKVKPAVADRGAIVVPMTSEYPPATWDPASVCNYQATEPGKDCVVIHVAEGTAAGARATFKTCGSAVSAHYVVSEAGTIWQMVHEAQTAWHAGCYNARGIGIVHEGFSNSPSHPDELYRASATLCRHLCDAWSIPIRRAADGNPGILGHSDTVAMCGADAGDPGPGWDWVYYLDRVRGNSAGPHMVSAVSRRTHGASGPFDIDLMVPAARECRTGGPVRLVVSFDRPIVCATGSPTTCVSVSSGSVNAVQSNSQTLTVDLSGAADRCWMQVTFPNLTGEDGMSVVDSLTFGVLGGDANGDGIVSIADYDTVRDAIGCVSCPGRLRCDLNVDGMVNTSDFVVVRGRLGRSLQPNCP